MISADTPKDTKLWYWAPWREMPEGPFLFRTSRPAENDEVFISCDKQSSRPRGTRSYNAAYCFYSRLEALQARVEHFEQKLRRAQADVARQEARERERATTSC